MVNDYKAKSADALIYQVHMMKFRLEAKYGPSIKKLWEKRRVRKTESDRIYAEMAKQESRTL